MVQSSANAGEPLWAGVDVGTQSLRVAVVDADGELTIGVDDGDPQALGAHVDPGPERLTGAR